MRAALLTDAGRAVVGRVPMPEPGPGEQLVRVEGCGICGSSLPLWEGRPWFAYPAEPGAPGHEIWGRTSDGCRVTGLGQQGFAEFVLMRDEELVELPPILDGDPFPGEALGCAVNVVRRSHVTAGDEVAIVGMGFLGTTVARLCELFGVRVTPVRRDEDPGRPFQTVIEAAGTQEALDTASRLVGADGLLVIAGFHQDGPRTIDLQSWNWRGLDVVNAHERQPARATAAIREAVRLAAARDLDVASLVTHRFGLDEIHEAFEAAARRGPGFLKAVVCP